ncbi:hypothetical protein GQ53DRAFT_673243, partial [Thozetella sp. PMI_491]
AARFLDNACGTGLISTVHSCLTPRAVGIDPSGTMIGGYDTKAQYQASDTYPWARVISTSLPLDSATFQGPGSHVFHLKVLGISFHHSNDPDPTTVRLARRLTSGGILFIANYLPHEVSLVAHPAVPTIISRGFSGYHVRNMLEAARVRRDSVSESLTSSFPSDPGGFPME